MKIPPSSILQVVSTTPLANVILHYRPGIKGAKREHFDFTLYLQIDKVVFLL